MKKIILIILAIALFGTGCTLDKTDDNPPKDNIIVEDEGNEIEETEETVKAEPIIASGKESPDFTLTNLEGEDISLSDFR